MERARRLRAVDRAVDWRSLRNAALAALGGMLLVSVCAANAAAPAARAARTRHATVCRTLRLRDLSLTLARARASKAGCRIRVVNPADDRDAERIVSRVRSPTRRRPRLIDVWLLPLCLQSADPGPPPGEPFITPGPTALISGLFLAGGPLASSGRCRPGTPSPGTITVTEPATGKTVASQVVTGDALATIRLPAGTYALQGTFADAFRNGQPIESIPVTVTIPPGRTVRQDVLTNIP